MLFCLDGYAQIFQVNRQQVRIEGGAFIQQFPTSDDNFMYIPDFEILPGNDTDINVYLNSTVPIWMLQLYLELPYGITVSNVRYSDEFRTLTNYNEDGYTYNENSITWKTVGQELRIISMNMTRRHAIPVCSSGQSVFTITLRASPNMAVGAYEITTNNFKFVAATSIDGEGFIGANKTCKLTILQSVSHVSLDKTNLNLEIGNNELLVATVSPEDAVIKTLLWSSGNPSVATVDQNGLVTAVSTGTTWIKASSTDGSGKSASCKVNVIQLATELTMNKTSTSIYVGGSETLVANVYPVSTSNKALQWSSNNTAIAAVDEHGKVSANSVGTAIITASTTDGSNLSAECSVTILGITSIKLNKTSTSIFIDSCETITAIIAPPETIKKALTWTSSNPEIASVAPTSESQTQQDWTVLTSDFDLSKKFRKVRVRPDNPNPSYCCYIFSRYPDGVEDDLIYAINTYILRVHDGCTSESNGYQGSSAFTAVGDGWYEYEFATDLYFHSAQQNVGNGYVMVLTEDEPTSPIDGITVTVNANKIGTATITATTTDGTNLNASCFVTVLQPVTSISLNKTNTSLFIGSSESLTVTLSPNNASIKDILWVSSNPAIAIVDENGTITALKAGTATITARTTDGSNLSASCAVTVLQRMVTSITLNKSSTSLYTGDSETLVATVSPSNASNKTVSWSSSKTSVATVDQNGKVTAVKAGTATITVRTTDGSNLSASCTVTVWQLATGITLNSDDFSLYVGYGKTLSAIITPDDATNKNVTWSSSNSTVATVNTSGYVTAKRIGTATITAKTKDGSNLTASCMVTVNGVTDIQLNTNEVLLLPGMTQSLRASLSPSEIDYSVVSWSTSNSSVATVAKNSNGWATVTAQGCGTAKLYARTTDGSNLTATCQVTVVPQWCFLQADTIHYVRGTSNTVVELPIELVNYKPVSGLQFDMLLGNNMTFNLRNGVPDIWLEDSRKARNHTVAVERQSEISDLYRVLVSSQTSQPLKGNDGVLLYANMQINKYGTAGLFPIRYSNITMAAPDETQYHQDPWQSYLSYEYVVGDANADTQVNVGDFGVTANKILNREVNSLYFSDAANVNQDDVVNVTDLVGIANIALGIRPKEIRRASSMHDGHGMMHDQASLYAITNDNQIVVALDNEVGIAGLQVDIALPQGVTVAEALLQGRAAGHDLQMETLPDGTVRLLVASFGDHDIAAGDDAILNLTLNGDLDGIATIGGIAAERSLISHELDKVSMALGVTGIDRLATYNEVRIYVRSGNIVIESPTDGTAQLVMLNGITRDLNVTAGRNTYPMESGYYVVRMAGITAKVKL